MNEIEKADGQESYGIEFECYQRDPAVEQERLNHGSQLQKQKDLDKKKQTQQVKIFY
jgi:hypothetical protein